MTSTIKTSTTGSPSSARRIVVVSAGLGQPSSTRLLADRLAEGVRAAAAADGADVADVAVQLIEVRPLARDLATQALTGVPSADLRAALAAVSEAEGAVVVTPIYNASFSGLFKLFVDAVEPIAWVDLPVVVAATGGTPRHALALDFAVRPLFAALRSRTAPTGVFAAAEDWASSGELAERITTATAELWQDVTSRPRSATRDPYQDPVPFARLLASA